MEKKRFMTPSVELLFFAFDQCVSSAPSFWFAIGIVGLFYLAVDFKTFTLDPYFFGVPSHVILRHVRIGNLKNDLQLAATAEEVYFVDNDTYKTDVSELHKTGYRQARNVQIKIFPGEGGLKRNFVIVSKDVSLKRSFIFDSTTYVVKEITGEALPNP